MVARLAVGLEAAVEEEVAVLLGVELAASSSLEEEVEAFAGVGVPPEIGVR